MFFYDKKIIFNKLGFFRLVKPVKNNRKCTYFCTPVGSIFGV